MILRMLFLIIMKKIKIDSDDDLPLEKTLTMYHAVFLVKSVFNKNKNYYCYNVSLDQLAKR